MFDYICGRISIVNPNYITIDNNNIGYKIFVPNPYSFEEEKEYKIFLYSYVREEEYSLYGFIDNETREMFLKLINVKGLGPKMALPILATGSLDGIKEAIEKENILYLTKFPKIGEKLSRQIILDLKGKLGVIATGEVVDTNSYEELIEVLKGLGYKEKEFKSVINKVDINLSIEDQVKEALKLLLK